MRVVCHDQVESGGHTGLYCSLYVNNISKGKKERKKNLGDGGGGGSCSLSSFCTHSLSSKYK